ncbi:hypothetical protein GF389_00370 [Candidatus Dojkabacteria bacterium]|nr:hypothetical protein [Candidatus Dojkabacteria bacterium]
MTELLPAALIDEGIITRVTLLMIIMFPIVGTIIGFTKHVIGLKSLGLYAPIVMTYAFFRIGLSSGHEDWIDQIIYGFKVGITLTIIVFVTSLIAHVITKRMRLHYSPKIALVLTTVAASMYIVILAADYFEMTTFLEGSFVPIVLLSTVSEQFVATMAQKNIKTAVNLTVTTGIVSFLTFMMIVYRPFQDLIIDYPYLLLLTLLINLIIGKFTGLRVLEYFRFQEVYPKQD